MYDNAQYNSDYNNIPIGNNQPIAQELARLQAEDDVWENMYRTPQ